MNPQANPFELYGATDETGMSSAVYDMKKYGSATIGMSLNPPSPIAEEAWAVPFNTICKLSLPNVKLPGAQTTDGKT